MKRIKLRVGNTQNKNLEKSLVYIRSTLCDKLDLEKEDLVEIHGPKKSIGAIVYPIEADDDGDGDGHEDENYNGPESEDFIQLDERLRKNLEIETGSYVSVAKIEKIHTKSIVLRSESLNINSNPRFDSFILKKLYKTVVSKGEKIYIGVGMTKNLIFSVVETIPEGISMIDSETEMEILSQDDKEVKSAPKQLLIKLFKYERSKNISLSTIQMVKTLDFSIKDAQSVFRSLNKPIKIKKTDIQWLDQIATIIYKKYSNPNIYSLLTDEELDLNIIEVRKIGQYLIEKQIIHTFPKFPC